MNTTIAANDGPPVPLNTAFMAWVAGATGFLACFAVWVTIGIGGTGVTKAFDDLTLVAVPLVAAALCARASQRQRNSTRRAWLLIGGSAASWGLGQAAWSYYELLAGRDVPFPSLADVGYLAAVPLAAAGLLLFPSVRPRATSRVRQLLDAMIIGVSVLFGSWATVLGPVYRGATDTFAKRVIGLAYPVGDVIVISIALFVAMRAGRGGRSQLLMIGTGAIALGVADSSFAYFTQQNAYTTGALSDAGWVAGFLLFGLAALRNGGPPVIHTWHPSKAGAIVPAAAVILAAGAAGVQEWSHSQLEPMLVWTGIVIVLLVVGRQFATVLENAELNKDLEGRVADRTAELQLSQDSLREAFERERRTTEQLRTLDRMKNTFLLGISHELRTPLATIVGAAKMLNRRMTRLSEEQVRELHANLEVKALELESLLADLLDLDRLLRGTIDARRQPTRISPLVRSAIDSIDLRGRILHVEMQDFTADVDRVQVERIIENLLANAVNHTPEQTSIWIRIRVEGDALVIDVEDSGPGVPAKDRPAIFEPFERGSADDATPGTGVGLSLVARFAALHGGNATVEPGGDGGARFIVRLAGAFPDPACTRPQATVASGEAILMSNAPSRRLT